MDTHFLGHGSPRSAAIFCLALAVSAFGASSAPAGPYVVDDAEIGEVGECEISAWHTHVDGGVSSTALAAACVVLPGLELGATGVRANEDGGVFAAELEAKFGLIEETEHGVGIALVAGAAFGFDPGSLDAVFVNLPVSYSPVDAFALNVNVGWEWDNGERVHLLTYGIGAEAELHPRLFAIAELHGASNGSLAMQAGFRPVIVPERLHLDLVYGRSLKGSADHSISVGLGFAF
ncbi:MAG: hypothetical protein ACXIVF_13455 [Rhizobiaceae bacterium]